jgi:hypothetical protein
VDLRDWFCFDVELVDCTFSGRLRGGWFNGTVPEEDRLTAGREHNEFHGNDFSAMELIDVDFRTGIDLTKQCLPSSSEYVYVPNAAAAVEKARAVVTHWGDLDLRRRAMVEIKILERSVAAGQRQFFLRPAEAYKALGKDAVDQLYGLLRLHGGGE